MEKIYLMMNKPAGYVCSAVSDSHKTVYSLLSLELQELLKAKRGEKLHTVGRLDCETSGLLIFTTDGNFSNHLTRPESHVIKQYKVKIRDQVDLLQQMEYKKLFKKGVVLPAEKKFPEQNSGPAQIEFLSNSECIVTIGEGKFHQVKRMFLSVGNEVIGLQRIKIGSLDLPSDLKEGEYRVLNSSEITALIEE